MALAEVIPLYESNRRDPVETLRKIADEIERGDLGAVGSVGIVVLGDTMEVYGAGEDSEAPSVALLLHAGFLRLSRSLEEHGRD